MKRLLMAVSVAGLLALAPTGTARADEGGRGGGHGSGNSGKGGGGDRNGNSGPGNAGDRNGNSGPGNAGDRNDNSGPGNAGDRDRDRDDNSGPGNAGDRNADRATQEARVEAMFEGFQAELNARFENRADRTRLTVEVENLNLPAGVAVNVCVGPALAGQIVLDAFHAGELELDSRKGQAVPMIQAGTTVQVRRDPCGSTFAPPILAVTFGQNALPPAEAEPRVRLEGRGEAAFMGFQAQLNARFEQRPDRRRFTAEVENVNLPAGTLLSVCLAGNTLGQITLDGLHSGELELDSREMKSVPAAKAEDVLAVRLGSCPDGGMLIVSAIIR